MLNLHKPTIQPQISNLDLHRQSCSSQAGGAVAQERSHIVNPISQGMEKSSGFTLIEILIVMVIIGIITATTLFSIGDGGQKRRIEAAANTLQSALLLAQTQAILTSSVVGFQAKKHSYAFYLFTTAPDRESQRLNAAWVRINNSTTLSRHTVPNSISLSLSVSDNLFKKIQDFKNDDSSDQPQVLILPSGGFTAFTLTLGDKRNAYVLKGNIAGNLSMQPIKLK